MTGRPAAPEAATAGGSQPPVAPRTTRAGDKPSKRCARSLIPYSSFGAIHRWDEGRRASPRVAFETSISTWTGWSTTFPPCTWPELGRYGLHSPKTVRALHTRGVATHAFGRSHDQEFLGLPHLPRQDPSNWLNVPDHGNRGRQDETPGFSPNTQ